MTQPQDQGYAQRPASTPVVVTDVQMNFGAMVVFMVKWALASIPAFVILAIVGPVAACLATAVVGGAAVGLGHH